MTPAADVEGYENRLPEAQHLTGASIDEVAAYTLSVRERLTVDEEQPASCLSVLNGVIYVAEVHPQEQRLPAIEEHFDRAAGDAADEEAADDENRLVPATRRLRRESRAMLHEKHVPDN